MTETPIYDALLREHHDPEHSVVEETCLGEAERTFVCTDCSLTWQEPALP